MLAQIDHTAPQTELLLGAFLLISLVFGSLGAWLRILFAWLEHRPWLENRGDARADWSRLPERMAVILCLVWFGLQLASKIASKLWPDLDRAEVVLSTTSLLSHLILSGGIAVLLPAMLLSNRRSPSEYGFRLNYLGDQIQDGFRGFLVAVLPMAATMIITAPFRTDDTKNPLLILLSNTSNPIDIILACVLAVIAAPLSEEMMFRVILQGWLATVIRPGLSIVMIVVGFAAIHGIVDGIALLPLAAVLGYVFQRRHSYISVVVIHFLFNGTMLLLQFLTQSAKIHNT